MTRLLQWIHALPFRIATKLSVVLTGGAIVVLALVTGVLTLHEREQLLAVMQRDLEVEAEALAPLLAESWAREGEGHTHALVRAANAANSKVVVSVVEVPTANGASSLRGVAFFPTRDGERALVVERSIPSSHTALAEAATAFLASALPLALFALLTAYKLGDWLVGAPLRRVIGRARGIGSGELEDHLVVQGSAEIVDLKIAINAMMDDLRRLRSRAEHEQRERLEAVERLRHADRLKTVGTLAAGVAHELGTPLNVIMLETNMTASAVARDAERALRGVESIRKQAERMSSVIRQMLDFARRKSTLRTTTPAAEVVESSARLVAALARAKSCRIEIDRREDEALVSTDVGGMQQVFANLFVNAFDAMQVRGGGTIIVRIVCATRGLAEVEDWVRIEVDDEGSGMDEETRQRVFEPFFTTKHVGEGTGLGLSVALGIVEDHGGFIEVAASARAGSVFAVHLPRARTGALEA